MESLIVIDGKSLNLSDLYRIVKDDQIKVQISSEALEKVKQSHTFVVEQMKKSVIYGVNTGFGPMASHVLGKEQLVELQENLVRSHATGIGKPIDSDYVLAAMVVRLNTLALGYSGVSVELLRQLERFINHRIIPVVPEHGAVGTSGDLVQLAHIAIALIGEGEVVYDNKRQATDDVLTQLNIKPYQLKAKEGLSLINGTSVMSAISALLSQEADRLTELAVQTGAIALELVGGFTDSFSDKLHKTRPHKGQIQVAAKLSEILASSELLRDRQSFGEKFKPEEDVRVIPETVQEVYSLRCIPQILGPVFDALEVTKEHIQIEINSATDNPLVNLEERSFLHGGNFHGDYVAMFIDQLKIALIKMTMLSERRINFFLNSKVNQFFPPFLNLKKPGLTLGLQALQFVATSTTAQSQNLAFPQYIHSIPTNADNQDIVSMGTEAALFTAKVIDNTYVVLAIELVVLSQAVDYLKVEDKLSAKSKEIYQKVRSITSKVYDDRFLSRELEDLVKSLKK